MLAVLGGLGAALCWGAGTLTATRASRLAPPRVVLAWVMVVGLAVVGPLLAVTARPEGLDRGDLGWMALGGAGNVAGLLIVYEALRRGKVSVISPIVSTEGAVAAAIAVATGERLGVASGLLLVGAVAGVVVAGSAGDGGTGEQPPLATALAGVAAVLFGASLYATGKVGQSLPLLWAVLPPRAVGVVAVALPSLAAGGLRLPRAAVPLVVCSGLCEIGGFASYALGSRHGIAVAAVLASQFAAVALVGAFLLFRERLRPAQALGIAAIGVCVAALSAIRA